MTKPYTVNKKYYAALDQVATVGTVSAVWRRSYNGVIYAIDAGNIAAVKCGKTWLVSLPSVTAYWGLPPCPIEHVSPLPAPATALQKRSKNGYRGSDNIREVGGVERALHGLRAQLLGQK